jgi:Mn2+/Fe2+ NRAMP family transporter
VEAACQYACSIMKLKLFKRQFLPRSAFRSVLIFLSVMGPGIITANIDNDAGGITTYSVAGASFGYTLLWTLIPVTIALIVVQEICARMGVVTGKGLADLIRENYGVRATFYIMIALLVADFGNTMAEFSGVAASLEIFSVSKYISIPLSAAFVWFLVVKGTYRRVEKIFLVASMFYITYIISGFLAEPDWHEVTRMTVFPTFHFDASFLVLFMGIVGTTITPWMQFYLQSSVVEKGIRVEEYKHSRLDVIIGGFMTDIVAFFIIVACGAVLYKHHISVETAADAALALGPLAGKYASELFAFGLFNASLFSASILPLATAYYVCEGFGWEAGVNKKFQEAPQFYSLFTFLIVVGALIVLIPGFPLIRVMLLTQVVNGMILPFVLIFMLSLVNNKEIMGEFVNSKTFNVISWITVIILILLTVAMLTTSFFGR